MTSLTAATLTPKLLALDWGTSSLRAFLMADGKVLETRQSAHGIQHLPTPGTPGYEQAFAAIAGDWLQRWPALPVVASGMVGSAQGWREAPYVPCPASTDDLAKQGVRVASGLGPEVLIAPGVLLDAKGAMPDVMRGEEIQIAGAFLENPKWAERCTIVLPGTHSKWVLIEDGRIVSFATYLTGELFAVLKNHSILGRLMPAATETPPETDVAAFELGLASARDSGPGELTHLIFGTRTLGLTGRVAPAALADYLSGLIIGSELVSGLAASRATHHGDAAALPIVMIGEPSLCRRYETSLAFFGVEPAAVFANTAPIGLWNFAGAAGLLK